MCGGVHWVLLLKETLKTDHGCFKNHLYSFNSTFSALSVPGCQENPDDLKESMCLAPSEAASTQETDCFTYFWVSQRILDSRCWRKDPGLGWGWEKWRSFVWRQRTDKCFRTLISSSHCPSRGRTPFRPPPWTAPEATWFSWLLESDRFCLAARQKFLPSNCGGKGILQEFTPIF